jgi:sterol desaturase/sphingolipid hydroxylase (fatty acid hydroxylase superfamily)
MPSPIEVLMTPESLVIFSLYAFLIAWEYLVPARTLPVVRYWKLSGALLFLSYFYVATYLPMFWDAYLIDYQQIDLTGLGTIEGFLVGFILYELATYVWHRCMHGSNFLWLGIHQMHHSAERLDTFSAFWFSPIGMVAWSALGSFCLVLVVGLTAEATILVIYAVTFLAVFTHTNIKTPHWLGYIVERPEAHSVHHATQVHAFNYCEIPIIDMLFGTFNNPKRDVLSTGFHSGSTYRVKDMLMFKDISEPYEKIETNFNG